MPLTIVPCKNNNYEEDRILIYLRNNINRDIFQEFLASNMALHGAKVHIIISRLFLSQDQ